MTRDYLAEGIAVSQGRCFVPVEREHIEAMYAALRNAAEPALFNLIEETHPFPDPEIAKVRFIGEQGQA